MFRSAGLLIICILKNAKRVQERERFEHHVID